MNVKRIGIIGCGAMGLYTLKNLVDSAASLEIHVFDSAEEPGKGMPYDEGMNAEFMLCNAFSREIPVLTQSLAQWLKGQSTAELGEWELRHDDIDSRAFYPRVLIGEFLAAEFEALCSVARNAGHRVHVHSGVRVDDITVNQESACMVYQTDGVAEHLVLDTVIIATGHDWPSKPQIDGVELQSPWPYTNITEQEPERIGILGSSLSAVDIVVTLGQTHGEFIEHADHVSWLANEDSNALNVTMVSRNGIMPEGDFYYPFPYEPLSCITEAAVAAEVDRGNSGLLQRVFELLLKELDAVDPAYLALLGKEARTVDGFASAYFKDREKRGGLEAVREDLQEVRASMRRKETIAYRYALLRGHENMEIALPSLVESEWELFKQHLLPVFADCYAALPHLSIARILAMKDAGALSIVASGDEAAFTRTASGMVQVEYNGEQQTFDCMFDARGQSSAPLSELHFPSLVQALQDPSSPILAPYKLAFSMETKASIYCLALPQVLERYPFSQGLPNCHELSRRVVADVLEANSGS